MSDLPALALKDPIAFSDKALGQAQLAFQRGDKSCLLEMESQAKLLAGVYSDRFGKAKEEHRAAQRLVLEVGRYIGQLLPSKAQGKRNDLSEARTSEQAIPRQRASEYRQMAEVPEVEARAYYDECEAEQRAPSRAGLIGKLANVPPAVRDFPELANLFSTWTRQRDWWQKVAGNPESLRQEFHDQGGEEHYPFEMLSERAREFQEAIGAALDAFTKPTFTVEGRTA